MRSRQSGWANGASSFSGWTRSAGAADEHQRTPLDTGCLDRIFFKRSTCHERGNYQHPINPVAAGSVGQGAAANRGDDMDVMHDKKSELAFVPGRGKWRDFRFLLDRSFGAAAQWQNRESHNRLIPLNTFSNGL